MDQARAGLILALIACGAEPVQPTPTVDAGEPEVRRLDLPFATAVESTELGEGAGFGEEDVVLGPPRARSEHQGSMDVLSLGHGGEIVLSFAPRVIVDGEGDDLIVFENAFLAQNGEVFAEPGSVALSEDGTTWHAFDCDPDNGEGCAGQSPSKAFDPTQPLSIERCGGDGFDLAELGLTEARFVKITDRGSDRTAPSAGFDLDAVGLIHHR